MNKHKTLILTIRPLHKAPRVLRQIETIKAKTTITAIGTTDPKIQGVEFIDYSKVFALGKIKRRLLKLKRSLYKRIGITTEPVNTISLDAKTFQKRLKCLINEINPTVVIIHEPNWLPCASFKDRNYTVIFNAHEYFPLQRETDEWQLRFGRGYYELYKNHLGDVDLLINVSSGIQQKCLDEFGKDSILIPNAPFYDNTLLASVTTPDVIKLVHHGNAAPNREIEIMIKAVGSLLNLYETGVIDIEYKLDLYLNGNEQYMSKLIFLANLYDNVRIMPHVDYEDIIKTINTYDIGIFLLPDNSFNHHHALPNKLFEYMQARIGIIITPLPDMMYFVKKYSTGIITDGFDAKACADTIKTLNPKKINEFKVNAGISAKQECADIHQQKIYNYMFS
jgi:glycosyltransferase involved in cell wall biosynthesis